MERKWGNDNGGSTAYKTAAIRDKDGSFGGGPNSYILINDGANDSIAADPDACEVKPTWNATVCKGDVGRLNIGGPGGGGGFGGGLGGGAGGPGGPAVGVPHPAGAPAVAAGPGPAGAPRPAAGTGAPGGGTSLQVSR